ncbi:transglutaminase-like domain-containing protein [Thalassovita taeanensis]|uniref:Transglutaminase-like superfamily protein n=1 Tax=Thalassovita taeanensis TaxID=657014 RepID=A0A1H9DFV8_9RHOB|nr:transglutaminase family protein [Thalassovita taeanensis]SEQ12356.1 Transglutaminase-like superfamily protein [Thalassovita taeanensis]
MILNLYAFLNYQMPQPTDVLLQIEAAEQPDQILHSANINLSLTNAFARVPAEHGIGERIWMQVEGDFYCTYQATLEITRDVPDLSALKATDLHALPGEAVRYLMPSRYCPSDEFYNFVSTEFGDTSGGPRIAAICDWIASRVNYVPGSSTTQTTAVHTFVQRQGICRDFAHVLISLARASGIPARFVSVYAPAVTPQDFHAVAEVYLNGDWHLIDPTGMAKADEMARIGVGLDAADVAFMNSFNPVQLIAQTVNVTTG